MNLEYRNLSKEELDKLYAQNDIEAVKQVGYRVICGIRGYKQNLNFGFKIVQWLIQDKKDKDSYCIAGLYYFIQNRYKEAIPWFKKHTEMFSESPLFVYEYLAWSYFHLGEYDEALKYFEPCAKLNKEGGLAGMYSCYFKKRQFKKSIEYLKKLEIRGHVYAYERLGHAYLYGQGVAPNNTVAYENFKMAASKGSLYGQYYVGNCKLFGTGTHKDVYEGFKIIYDVYYFKHPEAHVQFLCARDLAYCYRDGKGTSQNKEKAFLMFQIASGLEEDSEVEYELSLCYLNGEGTHQDYTLAYIHAEKSYKLDPQDDAKWVMDEARRNM